MDGARATLLLAKVPPSTNTFSVSCGLKLTSCRLHEVKPNQVLAVDHHGVLHEIVLGATQNTSHVASQYEMYLQGPGDQEPQLVRKPWKCFAAQDDGVIMSQSGSHKLLYVGLPMVEGDCSGAFLFGSHAAEVTCMISNKSYLVSGAADGSIKIWALADGSLIDSKEDAISSSTVALAWIGPLMVAAGNVEGYVTVYDISSDRLMPVQRFFVDDGPVTQIASRLTPNHLGSILCQAAPRGPDGGGVVQPPSGLPWHSAPYNMDAPDEAPTDALLAVASSAGWLHVYQPRVPGELAWKRLYSGSHRGDVRLAFSPDGSYLAVSSGVGSATIMLLDTVHWVAAHKWSLPSPLSDLGFLNPGSELAVFPETLQPAVKLSLYACPTDDLPVMLQAKLPVPSAAAQTAQAGGQLQGGAASPPPTDVRATNALPYRLSPDRTTAAATAMTRPSFRPSTLPTTRSWLTGGPPPEIDLSDVVAQQLQQQLQQQNAQPLPQQQSMAADSGSATLPQGEPAPYDTRLQRVHTLEWHTGPLIDRYGAEADAACVERSSYAVTDDQKDEAGEHGEDADEEEEDLRPRTVPAHLAGSWSNGGAQTGPPPHQHPPFPCAVSAGREAGTAAHLQQSYQWQEHQQVLPAEDTKAGVQGVTTIGAAASGADQYSGFAVSVDNAADNDGQDEDLEHIAPRLSDTSPQQVPRTLPQQGDANTGNLRNQVLHQSVGSMASTDTNLKRQHEFERAAFFGDRLVQMGGTGGSMDSQASIDPCGHVPQATSLTNPDVSEVDWKDDVSIADSTALHPQEIGMDQEERGDEGGNDEQDAGHELQLYEPTADFISNPAPLSQYAPPSHQQQRSGLPSTATSGGAKLAGPGRLGAANRPEAHSGRDYRSIGLRAPRAPNNAGHNLEVQESATAGGGGTTGHIASSQMPAPLPARSPFRGYKPHVSKIIKEIRRKGSRNAFSAMPSAAAAQTPAEDSKDGYPVLDQHSTHAVSTAYHSLHTVGGAPDAPSSLTSPMLMASPTSTVMRECAAERGHQPQRWGEAGVAWDVEADAGRAVSPLQRPAILSSKVLLKKVEALSMADPPAATGLSKAEQEEARRQAAAAAANVPTHAQLYPGLQPIDGLVQPPRVNKQLHPGWRASRLQKPNLRSLWKCEEQQQEVTNCTGLALYTRPTPTGVAAMVVAMY